MSSENVHNPGDGGSIKKIDTKSITFLITKSRKQKTNNNQTSNKQFTQPRQSYNPPQNLNYFLHQFTCTVNLYLHCYTTRKTLVEKSNTVNKIESYTRTKLLSQPGLLGALSS